MKQLTDFFVSSKKSFAVSGMPSSCCVRVPAPLMPDVALVELPPMNLETCTTVRTQCHRNSGLEEEEARSGAPADAARRCAVAPVPSIRAVNSGAGIGTHSPCHN